MKFGAKLQALRADAGWSQEELAARLGVSRQAVSKWELDKTVPDAATIVAVSGLFRVSTDYLLKDGETAPPTADPPKAPEPQLSSEDMTKLLVPGLTDRACVLLGIGNGMCATLVFLYLGYYCLGFQRLLGDRPLYGVLLAAPVVLIAGRLLLRKHTPLGPFHRSIALCVTLWGVAIALLCGFAEVIDDLLVSHVEGFAGIPILLVLLAVLLLPLWCAGWVLAKRMTRKLEA